MLKRGLTIGLYDTAAEGWTLTGCSFSPAVQVTNFVDVPGRRKGPLNMSTVLTDGDPVYGSRTLQATFECSEGDRLWREALINTMVNDLDGFTFDIILPDDPDHYITGQVHIETQYNDPAHAAVSLTAVCEPWRYNATETRVELRATGTSQTATLQNLGRMTVSPKLTVTGTQVTIQYGDISRALSPGVYDYLDLAVPKGGLSVTYSGTGSLLLTYREAVL